MVEISSISTGIAAIKAAIDLSNSIKDADSEYEIAQVKLRFAEIVDRLLETQSTLVEVKDLIREKDKKISELEEALTNRATLVWIEGSYYELSEDGVPGDEPYCSHCWETAGKTFHLSRRGPWGRTCTVCGNIFEE